jgi:predicted DsbA family dithiol-disulfide isomerase
LLVSPLEVGLTRHYAQRMSRSLLVQIWSDVACPWCYLGKRRLDAALAQFPHRESVQVKWKAFELDRHAPTVYPESPNYTERLAKKYGFPVQRAAQMINEMAARGAKEGVTFDFENVRGVNTFAAHQVAAFAARQDDGRAQHALAERLFHAYFTEGKVLSDHETLVNLGRDVGLDPNLVRAVLDGENHAAEARAEEAEAAELGVTGVPFFTIGRYAVEGAQPTELLLRVLNQAWQELDDAVSVQLEEGASCSVDGC